MKCCLQFGCKNISPTKRKSSEGHEVVNGENRKCENGDANLILSRAWVTIDGVWIGE
jgi:hypothetical protein